MYLILVKLNKCVKKRMQKPKESNELGFFRFFLYVDLGLKKS